MVGFSYVAKIIGILFGINDGLQKSEELMDYDTIELEGNHKLITMGFMGYVSYSRICRIGFAEYYGFALMTMWQ